MPIYKNIKNHPDVYKPFKPPQPFIDLTKDEDSEPYEIQVNGKTWFIHNGKRTEVIDLTEDNDSQNEEDEEQFNSNSYSFDPFYDRCISEETWSDEENNLSEEIPSDEDVESDSVDETDVEEEPPLKKQKNN